MPLSPLCVVAEGAGTFAPTTNGVDVSPLAKTKIKLADPSGVDKWFLQVIGTDELSSPPNLVGVNPLTNEATSPTTVVTLTFPPGTGHAVGFRSEVRAVSGGGGPIVTTFGIYSPTSFATRVGFVTETREGNSNFGWATKLNPLIRSGAGGSGGGSPDNYTLTLVEGEDKTIPVNQTMLFEDDVVLANGANLIVEGDLTDTHTVDNFSVLYVPVHSERVVQQNDEMLFTSDMVIDGQLTVDGQLSDATPYDGYDVLNALTLVAPNTPAILGAASPVSFLTPVQARDVMDVPSFAEMNAAIAAAATSQYDPIVKHTNFSAQINYTHYVWADDGLDKTVTLPGATLNGERVDLVGLGVGTDKMRLSSSFPIFYNPTESSPPNIGPDFPLSSARVTLEFKTAASTGEAFDAWYVISNGVNALFADLANVIANGAVVSDNVGNPYAVSLGDNSVLGRSGGGPPDDIFLNPGEVLCRPQGSHLSGWYPSALLPWNASPLQGPGTFTLEAHKVNRYIASSGLVLRMPLGATANNDEVEIKEVSDDAGTAPHAVTVIINFPFSVEKIGPGVAAQTDTLTEYKTWIRYKYDSSELVWRIVGAAYQLP